MGRMITPDVFVVWVTERFVVWVTNRFVVQPYKIWAKPKHIANLKWTTKSNVC
jgi:hypothetical protein